MPAALTRVLVLNGAGSEGVAALVEHGALLSEAREPGRGGAERLAGLVRGLLRAAAWQPASLDLIAAVTGPGSFTGLRAALSLAQGMALGMDVPLHGVTAMEALRRGVGDTQGRALWCVCMARRDRIFLECGDGSVRGCMLGELPQPATPVLLAGDAASLVALRLAPLAAASLVSEPAATAIAAVARDRHEDRLPALAALPLYVDPPEARPASGQRPPPA